MTEFRAQGRRILVVEDDATNRSVLARQLAMVGVDAEMARATARKACRAGWRAVSRWS